MLNKLVTYRSKTQFYWPSPDPANPTVPCYMHSEKPSLSFLSSSKNHKSGLTTFGFLSSGMWLVPSLREGGHPKKGVWTRPDRRKSILFHLHRTRVLSQRLCESDLNESGLAEPHPKDRVTAGRGERLWGKGDHLPCSKTLLATGF